MGGWWECPGDGPDPGWAAGRRQRIARRESLALGGHPLAILSPPGLEEEVDALAVRVLGGETVRRHETVRLHRDGSEVAISLNAAPLLNDIGVVIGAATLRRLFAGEIETAELKKRQMHADGRAVPVAINLSVVRGADGQVRHVLAQVRDVTERARAEQPWPRAATGRSRPSRLKSEFLANMSHEIRAPMNGVIDKAARTPVTAMTAHSMAGDRERCLEAAMDHYLAKPEQDHATASGHPSPQW